jgi:hypothetical protein
MQGILNQFDGRTLQFKNSRLKVAGYEKGGLGGCLLFIAVIEGSLLAFRISFCCSAEVICAVLAKSQKFMLCRSFLNGDKQHFLDIKA